MITITVELQGKDEALRLARMFEAYADAPVAYAPFDAPVVAQYANLRQVAADSGVPGAAGEIRLYPVPTEGVTTTLTASPPPTQPTPGSFGPDDARGIPWDERIHSSNRKLTDKGVWQRRRNISDELVAQVEAELAGYDPSHTATAALAVVVPPPPETVVSTIDPAVAPVAPVVPSPPAVPADPRANWPKTAKELMPLLVKGMSEGKFTVEHLNAACQQVGVENVNGFNMRPDLIPALVEELNLEVA